MALKEVGAAEAKKIKALMTLELGKWRYYLFKNYASKVVPHY